WFLPQFSLLMSAFASQSLAKRIYRKRQLCSPLSLAPVLSELTGKGVGKSSRAVKPFCYALNCWPPKLVAVGVTIAQARRAVVPPVFRSHDHLDYAFPLNINLFNMFLQWLAIF
ncbi:hypothetical protein L9F63_019134, partial [Diploptera punctata]